MATGRVREWRGEVGWGVIDSPDTPGGCWTHFSAIMMDGYRALGDGDTVSFDYEHAAQDGFGFRALRVWPSGVDPSTELSASLHHGRSSAYESTLTLHMDDGRILTGDEAHEFTRRADEQSSSD
jgi:CspA family cold shock protein